MDDNGCWNYLGGKDRSGYGKVTLRSPDGKKTTTNAHRVFYAALVASIPNGLQLDHLCRNTSCVNPAHLEPVSNGENVRRAVNATRPTCPSGHEFTSENTKRGAQGERRCRACLRERDAAYKRRWRKENPERLREINRAYYLAHREALIEAERERKARRKTV